MKWPKSTGPFLIAFFGSVMVFDLWVRADFHPIISSYVIIQVFVTLFLLTAEARRMETGE